MQEKETCFSLSNQKAFSKGLPRRRKKSSLKEILKQPRGSNDRGNGAGIRAESVDEIHEASLYVDEGKSKNGIFYQTVERCGIDLNVIGRFVEVRDQLFDVLFVQKNKKINYKFKIISQFKKIFDTGQDKHLFQVNINGTTLEFKKDRELIRNLVYDYYHWRDKAVREIMKFFENSYVVYELARKANVSHPSDVYDAINDSILTIMDTIKVTPYMFLYIKRWVETQLMRNLEKEKNKNTVPFSCLVDESEERGGEEGVMRSVYHVQDEFVREEVFCSDVLEKLIENSQEFYCEQGVSEDIDGAIYFDSDKSEEDQMFDRMLMGVFVEKLKAISD